MVTRVARVPSETVRLTGTVIEPLEAQEQAVGALRSVNAERLKRTLQVTAAAARERGLTQEKLTELLRRDS
jgi:hypothetical protein